MGREIFCDAQQAPREGGEQADSEAEREHAEDWCGREIVMRLRWPRVAGRSCDQLMAPLAKYERNFYSITSSARMRNDSGIARPMVLAALVLMKSSKMVGCSTGKSPGRAPRRILSMKLAARR